MKIKKNYFTLIMLILAQSVSLFAAPNDCAYLVDKNSMSIGWTAFKTTGKLPVNGVFTNFELSQKKGAQSFEDLMTGLKIEIDLNSVSTQNPERDLTLKEFFFGKLNGKIIGTVIKLDQPNKTLDLELQLNEKTRVLKMPYELQVDGLYKASQTIDLLNFEAQPALESMNKKCYELHKGPDGVSKTWSEVVINISGRIESCAK